MRFVFVLLFLSVFSFQLVGQPGETYTVMHYNLLYYGYHPGFCNDQNNNTDAKDDYLSTIIDYVQPDIFTVNELGQGPSGPQDPTNLFRILDNVLNASGEFRFSAAPYTNTKNSSIVNGLYYDNTKFVFHKGEVIANVLRDINLYSLYVKDEQMLLAGDTIFLHAVVAHLKAGSTTSDQNTRTAEVQTVMSYINQNNLRGNVMFLADYNMRSSVEFAYQHLTFHINQDIRFNDPINQPGTWWNNPDFAPYHTQSTRVTSGCFAGGGMDDRLDQILVTSSIMAGNKGLKYVEGSYYALGQDGNRFNQTLISPTNNSAPQDVINALYNMSDHLPVVLELQRVELASSTSNVLANQPQVLFNNPTRNSLNIEIVNLDGIATVSIFSLSGKLLNRLQLETYNYSTTYTFDIQDLASGIYLLRLEGNGFPPVTSKLIIAN